MPEYLVAHGCAAALSRCRDVAGVQPRRGDGVVIRTTRGLELGAVLCEASPTCERITSADLLRPANTTDQLAAEAQKKRGWTLLDDLQQWVETHGAPMQPLDADITLDGNDVQVHVLKWGEVFVQELIDSLRQSHGFQVSLIDDSQPAEHGCGSGGCGSCGEGGCGSGSGGCSSGGCSSGIASAAELTRHFAELREQMQARARVPLV